MSDIDVSLIVPVYNGEAGIRRCVESVLAQSIWEKMELIIVDDGSSDGTGTIIDEFAARSPRIRVMHIPNGGVSHARNVGMDAAAGEYIGFLDADDWVDRDGYAHLLSAARQTQADLVCGGFYVENGAGAPLPMPTARQQECLDGEEAVKRFLSGRLDVHIWTKLCRRERVDQVRFEPGIAIAEDRLFTFQALMKCKTVCLLPRCFYRYVQNRASVMHQSFSERNLDDLTVSRRIVDTVHQTLPQLLPYARCMEIGAQCRVLSRLAVSGNRKNYRKQYRELKRTVRRFPLGQMLRYDSRKHAAALLLTKVSPRLAEKLRENPGLKYKK